MQTYKLDRPWSCRKIFQGKRRSKQVKMAVVPQLSWGSWCSWGFGWVELHWLMGTNVAVILAAGLQTISHVSLLDPLFLTKAARVARCQRVRGRVHVYINEGIHQGRCQGNPRETLRTWPELWAFCVWRGYETWTTCRDWGWLRPLWYSWLRYRSYRHTTYCCIT
jgi:hypothetical protein